MVDGAHHDEGHQKQKLREKNNRYEGISLVKMDPVHSTLAATPSETAAPAHEADTDFDVFILDESDIDDVARNAYVKELADKSVLNIPQPKRVKNAFNEKDERENRLFQLFLSNPL
jgi:hypothetical protein